MPIEVSYIIVFVIFEYLACKLWNKFVEKHYPAIENKENIMEDKKYRYNVYLIAEEYSTGYVELTKKEAEIVKYATNTSNWKDKEIEPYSGFFGIDTEHPEEIEK